MTRAVTDILYKTDGQPWASAPVTFERTAGSFDDGSSWPPDEKQVTTDATGAYSVQLWPDAAGSIRSRYHVTYPNGDVFYVSIPDGTTPITMPEIRVAAVAPPVPPSALDAHVAAPDPHAAYLLPAEADLRYAALVHSQAWSTITGTPTTLGGYGITDAFSQAAADLRYAPIVHSQAWSTISGTPTTLLGYGITDAYTKGQVDTALGGKANAATTLAGYGITDAYTKTAGDARYAPIAHNQAWTTITGTPTTVAGYGISDVYTQTQSNANLALKANLAGGNSFTGAQTVTSDAIGTKPLIVKGFSGQTADLHQWQDSTGAILARVLPTGEVASSVRFIGGTFVQGAGVTASDTFITTGIVRASGGFNTRSPTVGDSGFYGMRAGGLGVALAHGSQDLLSVANVGGASGTVAQVTSGFNPSSGAGSVALLRLNPSVTPTGANSNTYNFLQIDPTINQSTFGTGALRGIYYNPTVTALNGSQHIAFQNTSGDVLLATTSGNVGIKTTNQFGGGAGVIGIANAGTIPSTNPTGGGVLYSEAGSLKWRNTAGTVTVLAP